MTLRRTLVALQVAVVALGLAAFGVASYVLYQRSEAHAAHTRLTSQVAPLAHELCQAVGACGHGFDSRPAGAAGPASTPACGTTVDARYINPTPGTYAELRSPSGSVLARIRVPFSSLACPDPRLPARVPLHGFMQVPSASEAPGPFLVFAVPASEGGATGPAGPNGFGPGQAGARALARDVVVVAIPINTITASLRNLRYLELGLGGTLIVLLALITRLLVRRSLEPLERMVATAGAIAGGDLSRRVPGGDPRSEIGQLGNALNHMLGSIEGAFAARDATEQRLRQFLADASHELRTPLTSIRGYAELWRLSSHGDDPPVDTATAMARIEHHAQRMGELIEELLLLARLDEARPPERRPVDLTVLAAEACDDAAAIDPERVVTLDAPASIV
ncbi:MAG: histidine kinase dimerization/phospho-acceptor domain-containing protein, partial [Acidimicrobiales bacterium]